MVSIALFKINLKMKTIKKLLLSFLGFVFLTAASLQGDTVKVGILHSLSGTMAISETSLRDVLLYTIDEINANGGVLGKQLEAVQADGASDWPMFAEKSEYLLAEEEAAVVFGCWTSVSRKYALPVFEKYNGLLFYPVQYEGEEESPNIFYTAEAVGQQAIPAVDYLLNEGYTKFYLIGTDYVYPQTTNIVLFEYLLSKGIPVELVEEFVMKGMLLFLPEITLLLVIQISNKLLLKLLTSLLLAMPALSIQLMVTPMFLSLRKSLHLA